MGLRLSAAGDVILENVFVPKENLLGEPGQGFKIAMKTLDASRVEVGAAAVGIAQSAIDYSVDYAKGRICFGAPIAKLQAIQFMLADMAINIEAARENLRLQELAFREGQANAAEVIDAQVALSIAQTQRAAAAYEYDLTLAELLSASGRIQDYGDYVARADKVVAR